MGASASVAARVLFVAGQQFNADLAGSYFAQGGYGRFVVADVVNQRLVAVFQLARAAGGNQGQIEVVRNFRGAVFGGDTCHIACFLSKK